VIHAEAKLLRYSRNKFLLVQAPFPKGLVWKKEHAGKGRKSDYDMT
jgi:hypothetical protein